MRTMTPAFMYSAAPCATGIFGVAMCCWISKMKQRSKHKVLGLHTRPLMRCFATGRWDLGHGKVATHVIGCVAVDGTADKSHLSIAAFDVGSSPLSNTRPVVF